MNILIYNWRDIRNPAAGGAEVFTHEIARRWVERGHGVTMFTSAFAGCGREEVVDGVRIFKKYENYLCYRTIEDSRWK